MKKLGLVLFSLCLALFLAACSEAPKQTKAPEPEAPPEPVTGREAYQKMYLKARLWSNDAELLRLQSISLEEVKDEGGKTAAWQGIFASPSKRRTKSVTFSVIEGPGNLHKGVFEGNESSYNGNDILISPVAIKVDSNEAWDVAAKEAKDYIAKNPDMPVFYILEVPVGSNNAQWRVVWGRSISTSAYSVYVDAATGKYIRTLH